MTLHYFPPPHPQMTVSEDEDLRILDNFVFSSSPMMDCVGVSLLQDMALEANHSFVLGLSSDVVPVSSTTANITILDGDSE